MDTLVLTADQQAAKDAFTSFLLDPNESVFVLSGFSGTGKSTLVKDLIDGLPKLMKTAKLVDPTSDMRWDIQLTATTNKAAETFSLITGQDVATIHSYLGLRVLRDPKTQTASVVAGHRATVKEQMLLFIDEASFIDKNLLGMIFKLTSNCKIVFIGDPAQLTPVKSSGTPVFNAGFSGSQLRSVVRQAEGNPIIDLSTKFRGTVETGEFFSFTPDGTHIKHMSRSDFDDAIKDEFTDIGWTYSRSKVLAWTNKTVIAYNKAIRNVVKGDPEFKVGDYAVCNKYVYSRKYSIKTDQLVHITDISPETTAEYDVIGNYFTVDNAFVGFVPKNNADRVAALKAAKADEDYGFIERVSNEWLDLRAAYACTINKAQGSTYDKVFIDLDDIKKCNSANQMARMLYVGVSRARTNVYFTGDLV